MKVYICNEYKTQPVKILCIIKRIFIFLLILAIAIDLTSCATDKTDYPTNKRPLHMIINTTEKYSEIGWGYGNARLNPLRTPSISMDYIPDNFYSVKCYDQGKNEVYMHFVSGESYFTFFRGTNKTPSFKREENDSATDKITINDYDGICSVIQSTYVIEWNSPKYVYSLIGNLERNEMIKISENIFSNDEYE